MHEIPISPKEFRDVQRFIFDAAGISLSDAKKALVTGRLAKRLHSHRLGSYGDYLRLLALDPAERQCALDLLTTNETYFFREPPHFEFLRRHVLPARQPGQAFRVWSAASSSGEECYSIAMLLDDCLGRAPWEVVGSDISSRMLARCRAGRYSMDRIQGIPQEYLRKYCLKGTGPEEGYLLVTRGLRQKLRFEQVNLNGALPDLGLFDVIFLRNVMIYFENDTKRQVVARLAEHLRPGGWLFIGHSESLHGINDRLRQIRPAIYQKP